MLEVLEHEQAEKRALLLKAASITKTYGPTIAVNQLDIEVYKGEVLALVGANGAGKSTLTKVLSGLVQCDEGNMEFDGHVLDMSRYTSHASRDMGIRVVHQELSLCKNLTVYENFYVEQYQSLGQYGLTWRKEAREMAKAALHEVFPENTIDVNAVLSTLSIAQQQMVEIARAISDKNMKLLILDEPTSSLPKRETEYLQEYIKKSSQDGLTYIYISHRLNEVMYLSDYIFIMQNGKRKMYCHVDHTNEEDMVNRMGDTVMKTESDDTFEFPALNETIHVKMDSYSKGMLKDISEAFYGGEIIGISGLEGNGQLELLQDIFTSGVRGKPDMSISGRVAYVAGDRKKEGIFPLGSLYDNLIISHLMKGKLFQRIKEDETTDIVDSWNTRLKTKCDSSDDPIVSLSGGNQQKVLIARALALNADIIILDDPTRGVDVTTKLELYGVLRQAAREGKLVLWRTSDDSELVYCSKVVIMRQGSVKGVFTHTEFNHSEMLKIAFQNAEKKEVNPHTKKSRAFLSLSSLITMIVLYGISGFMAPAILTKFGVELLAVGFAPFIFGALAQTFIIGLGHIDLSVGAFMGLINVICATILFENTVLGLLALLALLLLYSSMGIIVYWKKLPPIIVTLGMSFVWTGIAYMLQSMPGGTVPPWMVHTFNFNNPVLQGILVWLVLFIAAAVFIYRSKYGTILRGFGNNESAMINSGWSTVNAYWMTYLIGGIFALMGGIAQSAITGASDVNASATYTLLTVAAVIIGGGYFSGGIVTHLGSVFGGISLTMISVLLGLFRVSTDFTATIQGLVLILILSLRLLKKGKMA